MRTLSKVIITSCLLVAFSACKEKKSETSPEMAPNAVQDQGAAAPAAPAAPAEGAAAPAAPAAGGEAHH